MTDSTASSYRPPPSLPVCLPVCRDCGEKEIRSRVSQQKGGVKRSDAVKLKTLVEVQQNSGALILNTKKVRDQALSKISSTFS